MPVILVASLLLGSVVLALVGWWMVRNPVTWGDRFGTDAEPEAAPDPAHTRRSLVAGFAERLRRPAVRLAGERVMSYYRSRLDAAGHPEQIDAESFVARKAAYTLLLGLAGLLLTLTGSWVLGLLVAATGFFVQDVWLWRAVRRRQDALERDLPDFLDILSITVEAGLGFQSAMSRVSEAIGGPLGEEIGRAQQQMSLGMPRREALNALRRRNESEILDQFVTALLQAEELGAPLADTLRSLADDLREAWYQQARRRAARAAPRISLIVSFTLVPASMILIVAAIVLSSGLSLDILR